MTDQLTEYLRGEFKGLDVDRQVFRGRFPPAPTSARRRAGQEGRDEDKQVRIARVACAARRACDGLGASEAASLLVALTPAQLKSDSAGAELTLALGQTTGP